MFSHRRHCFEHASLAVGFKEALQFNSYGTQEDVFPQFFSNFSKYVKAELWHYIKWFGCATLAARFRKESKCLSITIGFKVPTVYSNSV